VVQNIPAYRELEVADVDRRGSALMARRRFAKPLFFVAFGVMALFVLWNNERFLVNADAPEWNRLNPVRWPLLPHGLGGATALGLGVLQFSSRLRRRYPRLHRVSGRLYIVGTFVAAPVAVWIAFVISPWFLIPFTIIQAITWALFTLVAYRCIRRGAVASHREWMIRSYAVALIFIEGRVLMAVPGIGRGGMDAIVLVNWACFAVTLVVVECMLRWREIMPPAHAKSLHGTAAN
jgi:uncharacterized membrane protein